MQEANAVNLAEARRALVLAWPMTWVITCGMFMNFSAKLVLLFGLLALLLFGPVTGCMGSPSYQIVRSSNPSALRGAQEVMVHFDWSRVNTDERTAEFLKDTFDVSKALFEEQFIDAMFLDVVRETGQKLQFTKSETAPRDDGLWLEIQPRELRLGAVRPDDFGTGRFDIRVQLAWIRHRQVTDVLDSENMLVTRADPAIFLNAAGHLVGRAAAEYFVEAQKSERG